MKSSLLQRRSVATRVLLSYLLVTIALLAVSSWWVVAQRRAAREAELLRSGYLPLTLALRDAVHGQDSWNSQLNHITSARNPVDKRVWFDTALKVGRPKAFGEVRAALSRTFVSSEDAAVRGVGADLTREASQIDAFLVADKQELRQLFDHLSRGELSEAEGLRDSLVTRGSQGKRRLSELESRARKNVDALLQTARTRELTTLRLAIGLSVFTVLVGLLAAIYTRRLLRPLWEVTERAKAVAQGDLTPRQIISSGDELGELAQTFEGMVRAIARANEQLVSSERLAMIGKMAALVTHEIRNPLSSIGLNAELLEEELGPENTEAQALLRAIRAEVDRLTELSEQYLSVARQRPTQLAMEDVSEVVAEAVDFIRKDIERRGLVFEQQLEPEVLAMVDEGQIKQVLLNLVRNAADAMGASGKITICVERAGEQVRLSVADEGEGIDEAVREHLFEPFFSTKRQGTGLGLPISRQIVEAHGGSILAEPNKPLGTRFIISLPALSEPAPRSV